MTKITIKVKSFRDVYDDLNETKKRLLRTAFLEEFEYSPTSDTFYKKLRGETFFSPKEQKWICGQLEIPTEEVQFPIHN